jgi:hypothetical protein
LKGKKIRDAPRSFLVGVIFKEVILRHYNRVNKSVNFSKVGLADVKPQLCHLVGQVIRLL